MNELKKGDWVVVFDTHRGIAYGRLFIWDRIVRLVVLEQARHVWSVNAKKETKGNWGLAVGGPGEGSRVGPPVELVEIADVAKVLRCSAKAVEAFKEARWD